MITEILIVILIIVIIILFCKILEFEHFTNEVESISSRTVGLDKETNLPDLDNKAPKEEDKINKLIVKGDKVDVNYSNKVKDLVKNETIDKIKNNIKIDNKDNNIKKEVKSELNQDVNIELSSKNDNDFSYNTTKHDINDLIKYEENKDKEKEKVEVKHKKELDNLKEINPEEENDIIKSKLTYSTKDIDSLALAKLRDADISASSEEMNKRYENQPEEYKQSFSDNKNTGFIYKDNVITDENIYTFNGFNYMSAHQLFIPTNYKTKPEDYGRNYIPPELWYKNNQRLNLPVCVPANGRCLVQDVPTIGFPVDSIEWHSSRKVMNPDGINTKYVREKLNTNHDDNTIIEN